MNQESAFTRVITNPAVVFVLGLGVLVLAFFTARAEHPTWFDGALILTALGCVPVSVSVLCVVLRTAFGKNGQRIHGSYNVLIYPLMYGLYIKTLLYPPDPVGAGHMAIFILPVVLTLFAVLASAAGTISLTLLDDRRLF